MSSATPIVDRIGPYRVVRALGSSGAASFVAREEGPIGFTREVVLKLIANPTPEDGRIVKELAREATICSKLNHPQHHPHSRLLRAREATRARARARGRRHPRRAPGLPPSERPPVVGRCGLLHRGGHSRSVGSRARPPRRRGGAHSHRAPVGERDVDRGLGKDGSSDWELRAGEGTDGSDTMSVQRRRLSRPVHDGVRSPSSSRWACA